MNEQQNFWGQEYADEYVRKNSIFNWEMGIKGWAQMVNRASNIQSVLECGCNIGRNINILNHLLPDAEKSIIEISKVAFDIATTKYELKNAYNGPIVNANFQKGAFDLVFSMGVLIHIHPDDLLANMEKMHSLTSKYILIGEYFNRTPVMIEYQGQKDKLFKRDFGKYFMENFNVKLLDNGFLWSYEYEVGGFDDITWWLFEKK